MNEKWTTQLIDDEHHRYCPKIIILGAETGKSVASVALVSIGYSGTAEDRKQDEADARLIAAAPDMLEVLEDSWQVIAALARGDKPDAWVMKCIEERMVEAIAKAKNETVNV